MREMVIVGGRSGRCRPEAVRRIAECRAAGGRAVVYVPEQMTLQTERDLITSLRLKGLLEIEVLSPKKLRMLVREQAGGGNRRTIGEAGQIMAAHRAMTEANEQLSVYGGMADLPGAVERIREAIAELRESDITRAETEEYAAQAETKAVRAKLQDMSRIRGVYEALVSEQFDDAKTAWTDTVRRLERTSLLQRADFFVYGFDTIRPDLRELLCAAVKLAERVTVFLTADKEDAPDRAIFQEQHRSIRKLEDQLEAQEAKLEKEWIDAPRAGCDPMLQWMDTQLFTEEPAPYPGEPGDGISLYAAADREDEAEQIAACLLQWRREGIPWERMAVALPDRSEPDGAMLSRLRLNNIPFTMTEKQPASSHGACRLLLTALACITEGYTAEWAADAAASGFTPLEDEEVLLLRDYAEANGIEGSRWREPFVRGADAEAAEAARRKLVGPMERLRETLKDAASGSAAVEAVVRFLEEEQAWDRLQERQETMLEEGMVREAAADRQAWKQLTEQLDEMWTLLGSREMTIRELRSILECTLGSAEITTLPESESGVVIGEAGHLLTGGLDALVLPGCREGILSAPDAGWLSDREREELLEGTGREVGMTRDRRCWIRKFDFYRTMTLPLKHLRVSRSLRDDSGGPAREDGLMMRLKTIFPGIREGGSVQGTGKAFRTRTPLGAMESVDALLAAPREFRTDPEAKRALISLLHSGIYGRTVRQIAAEEEKAIPAIGPETARRLFPAERTSISRLERYAACPYQHFIDYGLRPVRQETFEFDSADAGSFFHAALDRFMKTAGRAKDWPEWTDGQVDAWMDTVCAELTEEWEGGPLREDPLGVWQGEECLRRVHHAARVLTRFAANSDFRTIATEQSFGKQDGLPPLELTLADGSKVELQGQIDRIDTYENGEGVWLRVVDNKSSVKKPDPARMEDGEELQLMIYLKTAMQAVPGARPAGAMFFPVKDAEITVQDESPENIEAERLKKARMKGIVNIREDVMRAMDRELRPYSVDEVFKKDGSVRKDADWAVEEDVLQGLMDAAERKAAEICGEIRTGQIAPAPRGKNEEDSPCRTCGYRTLCRVRRESRRPRNDQTTYRDIAGKNNVAESGKMAYNQNG